MKALIFPNSNESSAYAKRYGYHDWIISRFLQFIPDLGYLLEKLDEEPQKYIRVNTLKISISELKASLQEKGFELADTLLPEVFAIKKATFPIGATTEYLLGYYYIQDISSCFAVEALDLKENQSVLDMAASPGGKTTLIAQKMKNTGRVVALESSFKRIRSISFNLARCGITNACVYNMDGQHAVKLNMKFDRVLLDAPCSCEGVIGKDKTRKTSHKPEDIEFCGTNQLRLIESALKVVKHDGLLIYSTCSFAPEENELIVNSMLEKFDVEIEPLQYGSEGLIKFGQYRFHPSLRNSRRLYPHIHNTTGFYIAKLRVR